MALGRLYLLPDTVGRGGITLFPNAERTDGEPFEIADFAIYALLHRLDRPGYSVYPVMISSAGKVASVVPVRFDGPTPDFAALGLLTTPLQFGIAVHLSPESFGILDADEHAARIKDGRWVQNKRDYQALGALCPLGIIAKLSAPHFALDKSLDELTRRFHEVYGTYGDLCDAVLLTFQRIRVACQVFCLPDAVALIDRNIDEDNAFFGPLLPILEAMPQIRDIERVLNLRGEVDSPFLILINFLRLIFDSLRTLYSDLSDMDDHYKFILAIRQFQSQNSIPLGNCDRLTAERLVAEAKKMPGRPLPIFAMAGIRLATRHEGYFAPVQPVGGEPSKDLPGQVREEITCAIGGFPHPNAKIKWMTRQIANQMKESAGWCADLGGRMAAAETTIDALGGRLKQVMLQSTAALQQVQKASEALDSAYSEHNRLREKFDGLRRRLEKGQRHTRAVVLLTIFVTFLGFLRVFFMGRR
jgi:hypothetical protein